MSTEITHSHPTKYWHKLEDNRIQCDVCPRACKLKESQRGFCYVRARENNQIVSTTYGYSSGFCIDPIEKKPLNHFLPGTSALSFGTAGCNLGCLFCQNWDISKSKELDILTQVATPRNIAEAAKKHGCKSVAFTYNDPVVFIEYAIDVAKECHKLGIKTVAVTNGYICEKPRKEFFSHMDAANVDLKGFTEDFYQKITLSHLQPVLNTLIYLKDETNVWLEITTLLIPGKNDSEKEIDELTQWIVKKLGPNVPLHFSAFHPDWKMQDVPSTPPKTVIQAREIALKNGINYVYTGNIRDSKGSNTYCHYCHKNIIKRTANNIADYKLNEEARCPFCSTKCIGIFEKSEGQWRGNQQPICLGSNKVYEGKQHG